MPRPTPIIVPDCAHHIRERGIRKNPIFYDDSDRLVYLRVLKQACQEYALEICAYCLMTNHIHLIAVPRTITSIARTLHDAHTSYSIYFNRKYGFVGHVWQRRADICVMDEPHLWNAIRYVERNPVRAGIVERAEAYLWSSAAAHCGLRDDSLLSSDFPPPGAISDWSEWLKLEHTYDETKQIQLHTSTGRPWVTPDFLVELERLTGRNLKPCKRGRPKKPA